MRITEERRAELRKSTDPIIQELLNDIELADSGITISLNMSLRQMHENDEIRKRVNLLKEEVLVLKDKLRVQEQINSIKSQINDHQNQIKELQKHLKTIEHNLIRDSWKQL